MSNILIVDANSQVKSKIQDKKSLKFSCTFKESIDLLNCEADEKNFILVLFCLNKINYDQILTIQSKIEHCLGQRAEIFLMTVKDQLKDEAIFHFFSVDSEKYYTIVEPLLTRFFEERITLKTEFLKSNKVIQ